MTIAVATDLDYLISSLRLHLGDIDSDSYRYVDGWLRVALVDAMKELERWWSSRYYINSTTYVVTRNSDSTYVTASPPIVETRDEKPIILMASLMIKSGSLEANSWSTGSWRDAEFSVSNIEGSKSKQASFKADWEALTAIMKPPTKRPFPAQRDSIYGANENNNTF